MGPYCLRAAIFVLELDGEHHSPLTNKTIQILSFIQRELEIVFFPKRNLKKL